jgi:hypothetical protein
MATNRRNQISNLVPDNIDSEQYPLPASEVKLTPPERAMLADPNWITEDEADLIMSKRGERR